MTGTPKMSIVVCTYNRAEILRKCLATLTGQTAVSQTFEVLVVDNGSTDQTSEVVNFFLVNYDNFRYIIDPEVGLCHARNTGYRQALASWVAYIDDDCFVREDYVEQAILATGTYNFDCFGGKHYAYYAQERPKWIPEGFGESPHNQWQEACELHETYNVGLNIVFNKIALEEMGGFDIELGMKGDQIGYADETMLQLKMRQHGYRIGFIPNLVVDHLVRSDKLKLSWHLRAHYAAGRDERGINYEQYSVLDLVRATLVVLLKVMPRKTLQFVLDKEYYWGNLVIDVAGPIYQFWGRLAGARLLAKDN